MNNLYVMSEGNSLPVVDDAELIEYRHDLTGIDDPLSLDLDELDQKKWGQHRCHQRFQLKEDTFALIRSKSAGPLNIQGKSMGCIACAVFNAKPSRLGKIENISMGGLMFQHVVGKTQFRKTLVLDILLADCRFYLANMPFKMLSDLVLAEDIPNTSFKMRQVRLQFQSLNIIQQTRLKDFIVNHGTQIGEISVRE
jgi:hypothetical protein